MGVIIDVININDNSPAFSSQSYYFSVVENAETFTTVGVLTATDADVNDIGTLKFKIVSGAEGRFFIDSRNGTGTCI